MCVIYMFAVVQSLISFNPGLSPRVLLRVNPGLILIGFWTTGPRLTKGQLRTLNIFCCWCVCDPLFIIINLSWSKLNIIIKWICFPSGWPTISFDYYPYRCIWSQIIQAVVYMTVLFFPTIRYFKVGKTSFCYWGRNNPKVILLFLTTFSVCI